MASSNTDQGTPAPADERRADDVEASDDGLDELGDLDDLDFDLDEVENKIAPLALALA